MPGQNPIFIPGPTNIPDAVRHAIDVPMEDMRAPDFPEFTLPLFADLKKIFRMDDGEVFIFPSSGTGGWEAAMTNTLSPGDKVLNTRHGQFSMLWSQMGERLGLDVVNVDVPWGEGVPVARYAEILEADKDHAIKAVLVCHNETATGVTSDVAAVRAMMGIMPGHIYARGHVGIVGRSGTLGYEAASQMKALGIGVTTSVGIGGDPINGSSFRDILELFEADPETHAVMMIGEIGGPQEAEAAAYARDHMSKPVVAYVAGLTAPKGRKMGHAGAIISAFGESAAEKAEILKEAGVTVAPSPAELGSTMARVLG